MIPYCKELVMFPPEEATLMLKALPRLMRAASPNRFQESISSAGAMNKALSSQRASQNHGHTWKQVAIIYCSRWQFPCASAKSPLRLHIFELLQVSGTYIGVTRRDLS